MHGTGCVLSAAIAARLALGDPLPAAIEVAKGYVSTAIEGSVTLGKGHVSFEILNFEFLNWGTRPVARLGRTVWL